MNPNAPSWGQQGGNNQQYYQQPQQQQGQYNQYQQQQQFNNPYAQQGQFVTHQQQFNNPYAQQQAQAQQQYYQQQQFNQQQQYNQQQNYQQNYQQNNQYQQNQQQYNNNQGYNNNNQYNQGYNNQNQGGYDQRNQNQYNNNQNQGGYNQRNQNNNNNYDNWDDDDNQQPQPKYGTKILQNNRNQQAQGNTLDDGSDNEQGQKKKKRKRGGRKKKNKNKDNQNENNESNNKESSNQTSATQSPQREKSNAMDEITTKMEQINVEDKPRPTPKKEKEDNKPEPEPEPKQEESKPKPSKNESNAKSTRTKPKPKQNEEEEKKPEPTKKKKKKKKVVWDAHDPREHLNLVLIGHVDAGKSTISGQILLATNQIDERTIAKYKKEAKEKNRESWWIAYIMDEDDEERNKGKTVECGRAHFDTETRRYTILDAPGHKNYVPNMISGAQQADVAILVISARRGEFEAGFDRGGQTREHGLLAMTLGISRVVVVVNKMDTCKWRKDRYDEIQTRVSKFLCDDIGFKKKYVEFLPISGQTATNIKEAVTKETCPWWDGPTLLKALDSLKKVKRATGNELRIPILDRYKGDKGLQGIGKVEAGIIKCGQKVMIMPTEVETTIVGLSIDDEIVESVGAGENILITFDKGALSMDQIYGGCVICSTEEPTKVVEEFLAEIYIHELPTGIMTAGYQAMFHCHNVSTMCEITAIPHKLHKKTMKRSKIPPPFLRSHDRAIARIKLDQKCALESFDDCAALGRFTLRDQGKTVVIGKIREIFASKSRLKSKRKDK